MNVNRIWKKFLNESLDTFERYKEFLRPNKEGYVDLYHVSSTPDIKNLDPEISAQNRNIFSNREYRTWDRPRIFFFTKMGQKDPGIGRIPGENIYVSKVEFDKLYPAHEDPLGLSKQDKYQRFQELTGLDRYHPRFLNPYERTATLAEDLGYIGFMYKHSGTENIIVAVWEKIPVEKLENSFYKNQERL